MKLSILITLSALILSSCGDSEEFSLRYDPATAGLKGYKNGVRDANFYNQINSEVGQYFHYVRDQDLDQISQDYLSEDFHRILTLQIEATPNSLYEKIFSGRETTDLLRYVGDRVKYFIPEMSDYEIESRIYAHVDSEIAYSPPSHLRGAFQRTITMGVNYGALLWWESIAGLHRSFRINQDYIELKDSRVGIVMIGPGYKKAEQVHRIGTMIHEPRHSDCTGGLSSENVRHAQKNRGRSFTGPKQCMHRHSTCPSTYPSGKPHLLAYETACDEHPGGAYFIEAVFGANGYKNCRNCDDEEEFEFLALALDSLSRLQYLDKIVNKNHDYWVDDLLEDRYTRQFGDPDMTSEGIRP